MHRTTTFRALFFVFLLVCLIGTGAAGDFRDPEIVAIISETNTSETETTQSNLVLLSSAPINPEFIAYQEQKNDYDDQYRTDKWFVSGIDPSPLDFSHTTGMQIQQKEEVSRLFSTTQSAYDLRDFGKVTRIRDQGQEGNCWAFATYASLESFFMTDEERDFSENNMKNSIYRDFDGKEGGNRWKSTAYLTRFDGPVLEEDDPYRIGPATIPEGVPPVKHIRNVLFIPEREDPLDNENIKWALTEYGVVQVSFFWDEDGYNPDTYAFYQNQKTTTNHAVAIVGWDDEFDKSNFPTQPPGDGAFIIKNSWGSTWGDRGYFHLSYYDTSIRNMAVFTGEDTETADLVYQYDPMGWIDSIGFSSDTAWFANIFTAGSVETITAVGFYTPVVNASYQIDVYTDPDDGPWQSGGLVSSATGTIDCPGYTTIDIPDARLAADQQFSVIVRLETDGYFFPIPIEWAYPNYSGNATANPNEGYISTNGAEWHDITGVSIENIDMTTASVCLKAYTTVSSIPEAAFSANVTSGDAPLAVAFTDASTGTPTAWYWDFGDGAGSRVREPTHVYIRPGEYTVNLTVSNSQGQDSEVKTGYITVARDQVEISVLPADSTLRVGETGEYRVILSQLPDGLGSFDIDINLTEQGIARITRLNITEGTGNYSALPAESVSCWSMTHIPPETENCTIVTISIEALTEGTTNLTVTRADLWPEYETVTIPAEIRIGSSIPPVANFTANRTIGSIPLVVAFTDTSTGGPIEWLWDFGDGGSSTLRNPEHTYTMPGTYTVNLTATNSLGSDSEVKNAYITALSPVSDMTIRAGSLDLGTGMNGTIPISVTNITNAEGIGYTITFNPFSVGIMDVAVNTSVAEGTDITYEINNQTGTLEVAMTRTNGTYTAGAVPLRILDITIRAENAIGESQIGIRDAEWSRNFIDIPFGRIEAGILNIHLRADFNRNNRIDIGDVAKVAWMAAGLVPEDPEADFDGEGHVTGADAARIAYYYVGKIQAL
jgi:C1A family cysteine protease